MVTESLLSVPAPDQNTVPVFHCVPGASRTPSVTVDSAAGAPQHQPPLTPKPVSALPTAAPPATLAALANGAAATRVAASSAEILAFMFDSLVVVRGDVRALPRNRNGRVEGRESPK